MTDFLHFIFPFASETKERKLAREILAQLKGGEGSGNFGHEGRPGEVGGSSPSHYQSEPGGRAEGGGLTQGINQSLYAGGQFLPMSPEGKAEKFNQGKRKDYLEKKQEVAPYQWEKPPSIDNVPLLSKGEWEVLEFDRQSKSVKIGERTPGIWKYIGILPGSDSYNSLVARVNLFNSGERWQYNPERAARFRHEKSPADFANKELS